jgi:charged multivesicular body protein 2A
MSFILDMFKKTSPEEKLREYKRGLDRTIRDLEKERARLETQQKKLQTDMKKAAKADQMESVKIMAKDLVRSRHYAHKFSRMKTQIQAVALRLQTMSSTAQMAKAMAGVTKAMRSMNRGLNLPAMQGIMREFERQNEMMGMKEDMMAEAIDEAMEDADDEQEMDSEVSKVVDEIMLDFKEKSAGVPAGAMPAGQQMAAMEATEEDKELEARLASLRAAAK